VGRGACGLRDQGSGFRVQGPGFRVQSVGLNGGQTVVDGPVEGRDGQAVAVDLAQPLGPAIRGHESVIQVAMQLLSLPYSGRKFYFLDSMGNEV